MSQKVTPIFAVKGGPTDNALTALRDNDLLTSEQRTAHHDAILSQGNALAQRIAELEAELFTDPVTGGKNRKAAMNHLNDVITEISNNPVVKYEVVFLDLDGFKQVNDACGHEAGDDALIEATQRLSNAIGDDDIVGRLGGDEIVLVLKHGPDRDLSPQSIKFITARLLDGMGIWNFKNGEETYHPIGASVGQHTINHDEMQNVGRGNYANYVMSKADENMYQDKAEKLMRLQREEQTAMAALAFQVDMCAA